MIQQKKEPKYNKYHRDFGQMHQQPIKSISIILPKMISDNIDTQNKLAIIFKNIDQKFKQTQKYSDLFVLFLQLSDQTYQILKDEKIKFGSQKFKHLIERHKYQIPNFDCRNLSFLFLIDLLFKYLDVHTTFSRQVYQRFRSLPQQIMNTFRTNLKSQTQQKQTIFDVLLQIKELQTIKKSINQNQIQKTIQEVNYNIGFWLKGKDNKQTKKEQQNEQQNEQKNEQKKKLEKFYQKISSEAINHKKNIIAVLHIHWKELIILALKNNLPQYFKSRLNKWEKFPSMKSGLLKTKVNKQLLKLLEDDIFDVIDWKQNKLINSEYYHYQHQ